MLTTLKKALFLLSPRTRWQAAILGSLILVGSSLEAVGVGLVFPLIKIISDPSVVQSTPAIAKIHNLLGRPEQSTFLAYCILGLFLTFVFKNTFMAFLVYWQNRFAFENEAILSKRLFSGYLHTPYAMAVQRNSADLIRTAADSVFVVFNNIIIPAITVVTECLILLSISVLLFVMEPMIAVLACGVLGVGVLVFDRLLRRRFVGYGKTNHALTANALRYLHQGLGSSKEIRVLGCQDYFLDAYYGVRNRLSHIRTMNATLGQFPRLAIETTMLGCMLLIILLVNQQGRSSSDIMAAIGMFGIAAFRMMPSANRIVYSLNNMKYGQAPLNAVFEDITTCEKMRWKPTVADGTRAPEFSQALSLDNVSYRYPTSTQDVLSDISLRIRPGESVALVGPSGSGKTTLADLILGLLTPVGGTIQVDGKDLGEYCEDWQKKIGFVPQTISLLDDTLKKNIAFGQLDGDIDTALVRDAVRSAHLDEVVADLPDGIDTPIGENGARLSGGQRQRIGIARALYGRPQILVLDEATSSLDNQTEREITKAIEELSRNRTLIVIAHRLSTVRNCDRLIFMKEGRILDEGTFESLLENNEEFRFMVRATDGNTELPTHREPERAEQPTTM